MDPYQELEQGVLGGLLVKPSLIRVSLVLPEYFRERNYRNLCKLLIKKAGQFNNWHEIKALYDVKYPHTMGPDNWDVLIDSFIGYAVFNSNLKLLRQHYNRLRLQDVATEYTRDPSDDNLSSLQTAMADLKEPDTVKVETPKDLQKGFEYELQHDMPEGLKTYRGIDTALNGGLRGGNLIVIGARPAVGKSALALNLLLAASLRNHNFTGDLFSLEMRNEENRNRMLAYETGIQVSKFHNVKKRLGDEDKAKARKVMQDFTHMGIQFYDNFKSPSQIVAQIRRRALAAKRGHYLAVVDYLQLLHTERRLESRVLEVGEITRTFKVLTNELDIPIILLSQLNRASLGKQEDTLADLRESGSIEQDANVVAFLSNVDDQGNNEDKQHVQLRILKNRAGRLARIDFKFFKDVQSFIETF